MSALASVSPIGGSLDLDAYVGEWLDHLRASNKSPNTIATYGYAAKSLQAFMTGKGWPTDLALATTKRLEAWQRWLLGKGSDATANNYYRGLRSLFAWLVEEGEIEVSPMAAMTAPKIGEKVVPVVTVENMRAMLRTCEGSRDFRDVRDLAILRLFVDSGVRLAEITNVALSDIDRTAKTIVVTGKGSKQRVIHYGPKAAVALNRYLRARSKHRLAALDALWLGKGGAMTRSGLYQITRRRATLAGFVVHPHQFRHTFAHEWLLAGGNEVDLMALCGWSNNAMLNRYGKSAAGVRARAAHAKLGLGERV